MASVNRWTVVAGALIVQLCLGALYAWSVFVKPLKDMGYSTTETQIVFSVALATFALAMIFAGRWQDRVGPKKVATVGGILFGGGYILASFTGASFVPFILTIGVIAGAGVGCAYVSPIAACVKWFPDKRGLVTGLAVAGFGAGAWIFAQLATSFMKSYGLMSAFQYLGIIFLFAVVIGAQFLRNPAEGYIPNGWNPPEKATSKQTIDYSWKEMTRTPQFWMLWFMYVFGSAAGLMVIGNLKPFGIYSGLAEVVAGAAVGIYALFNGAGRITWGWLSDKLGRSRAMSVNFALQGLMMMVLMSMGSTELKLTIAAAWIGFNYGGIFALFPSAIADYFGSKNLGVNYGFLFTSYGVGGIFGPILGGMIFDKTGSYLWAFVPSGILCLIAAGLAFALKKPKK
jgi:OFA family oxalate/formate antiporter-like MFS transporter